MPSPQTLPVLILTPQQQERGISLVAEVFGDPVILDATNLTDPELAEALAALAHKLGGLTRDSLTDLPDRRQGLARLTELSELTDTSEGERLGVVLIDIDHFKQVNDTFGHAEGDHVLRGVGELLLVPRDGLILTSRFGGEEFLALFQAPLATSLRIVEDLKDSFTTLRLPDGRGVTASFGVAFAQTGDSAQDLLKRADQNLYQAKRDGRNRIVAETVDRGGLSDFEIELQDYENRVRVFADRLVTNLTSRGRKMALSLRDEADHDSLTGLHNRGYFNRRLDREIQRSRELNSPLSVILLDLDDFGGVNRDYGYPAGDEALREAAQTLRRGIRVTDWAARYGGEELCGIFPDSNTTTVREIAERIRKSLTELNLAGVDGRTFRISGSLGVVTLDPSDLTADHLIQRAGLAVRVSKTGGKNRVTVA